MGVGAEGRARVLWRRLLDGHQPPVAAAPQPHARGVVARPRRRLRQERRSWPRSRLSPSAGRPLTVGLLFYTSLPGGSQSPHDAEPPLPNLPGTVPSGAALSTRMTWSAPSGATRGSASAGATPAPSVHTCRLLIGGSHAVGWGNFSAQLPPDYACRFQVLLSGLGSHERRNKANAGCRSAVRYCCRCRGLATRTGCASCWRAAPPLCTSSTLESEAVLLYSKSVDRLPLCSAVFIASLVLTRGSEDTRPSSRPEVGVFRTQVTH